MKTVSAQVNFLSQDVHGTSSMRVVIDTDYNEGQSALNVGLVTMTLNLMGLVGAREDYVLAAGVAVQLLLLVEVPLGCLGTPLQRRVAVTIDPAKYPSLTRSCLVAGTFEAKEVLCTVNDPTSGGVDELFQLTQRPSTVELAVPSLDLGTNQAETSSAVQEAKRPSDLC